MVSLPNLLFGDARFSALAREFESMYINSVSVSFSASDNIVALNSDGNPANADR